MNLAAQLSELEFGPATSDWEGFEVNRGYAVMALPMSSGHVLGLRVFPRTDFGGYLSVWHRDPDRGWAQYVDRGPVEAGCPRVWGPALAHAAHASIRVEWTGPMQLEVTMDQPRLDWVLQMERTLPLALLNAVHRRFPRWTWRSSLLVRMRERALRALGLGPVALTGTLPVGEQLIAVLQRMYWIGRSRALLDGEDLGEPVVLRTCPTIGGWPLPRRGVLAAGEAHATIGDRDDYRRLRHQTVGARPGQ